MNEKMINGQQVNDVISTTSKREIGVTESKDNQSSIFLCILGNLNNLLMSSESFQNICMLKF